MTRDISMDGLLSMISRIRQIWESPMPKILRGDNMLLNEILQVQPMTGPTALTFFLKYQYPIIKPWRGYLVEPQLPPSRFIESVEY